MAHVVIRYVTELAGKGCVLSMSIPGQPFIREIYYVYSQYIRF